MWAQWTLPRYFDPKHKITTLQKSDRGCIKKVTRIANFHVGSRGRLCENMSIQFNIQRVTTIAFKRSETLQSCLKMFMLSPEVVFVKTCIFFVFLPQNPTLTTRTRILNSSSSIDSVLKNTDGDISETKRATYQRSDGCKNGRIIPRLWLWWCNDVCDTSVHNPISVMCGSH